MRPGFFTLEQSFVFHSDVVHQALLEELPGLGIDVQYESCLNSVIDATAGVSATVPAEHIVISIRCLDRSSCTVRVQGYTRLNLGLPLTFQYPSNCTLIMETLDQRLYKAPPLDALSFEQKLRVQFGSAHKKKSSKAWRLIRVLFWCYVGYLFFK